MEKLVPFLQKNWEQAGFAAPSMIQQAVFGPISEGKNIVGIAPTGSGKTLAYLLPLLNQMTEGDPSQIVILTSSQELAMQVTTVAREWLQSSNMKAQPLIGGANIKRQQDALKKRPELLIGTPGRVLELITSKKIKANHIQKIVFDEVDQLVQGQSLQLIQKITRSLDRSVQKLYFSATAGKVSEQLQALTPDVFVIDVSEEDDSQGEVIHYFLEVSERRKIDQLRRLLNIPEFLGLIFFNQVTDMGSAEQKLSYHHLAVASLASDQSKLSRKQAIERFKKRQLQALLTTDVASRGLDIEGLMVVVNADTPLNEDSYLHRAGRVGRMGNSGAVLSMVTPMELKDLKKISKSLNVELQQVYLYGGSLQTEKPAKETQPKKKKVKNKGKRRK